MNALNADELDVIKGISEEYFENKFWAFSQKGICIEGELYSILDDRGEGTGMYFSDKLNALKFTLMLPMLAEKQGATGFNPNYRHSTTTEVPYTRKWNPIEGTEVVKNLKCLEVNHEGIPITPLNMGVYTNPQVADSPYSFTCNIAGTPNLRYVSLEEFNKNITLTKEGKAISIMPKLCDEITNLHSIISQILETTDDKKVKQLLAPFDYAELNIDVVKENVV
tara:strand:+ start:3504 stop:4172 length:669 start_codon:yes stop_codon:yes gene_type:complete